MKDVFVKDLTTHKRLSNLRCQIEQCDATNMTFALDDFVLSAFGGMDSSQEALKNCKSYSFEPPPESCVDFVERIKTDINSSIVGSCPREELVSLEK